MGQKLSAQTIATMYTLEQIDAKIVALESSLTGATQGGYSFDSGQHKQTVTPPGNVESIESLLAVYMKARAIKTGAYKGAQIVSVNYTP